LWFGQDRKQETLDEFFRTQLKESQRKRIEAACVDMWRPFTNSIEQWAGNCRIRSAQDKQIHSRRPFFSIAYTGRLGFSYWDCARKCSFAHLEPSERYRALYGEKIRLHIRSCEKRSGFPGCFSPNQEHCAPFLAPAESQIMATGSRVACVRTRIWGASTPTLG
jgi:hypothetical protein